MNFKQALNELIGGKKIRRKNWEDGHYWVLDKSGTLVNSIGNIPIINKNQLIEQNNWEVYVDENNILVEELGILENRLKEVIKRLKKTK